MIKQEPQTLQEAMEALTLFAELDEHADLYELTHDLKEDHTHQEVMEWLSNFDPEHAMKAIRRLFRIVYEHVRTLSSEAKSGGDQERIIRGLKMMMAIAGEAARRLDHIAVLIYGTSQGAITRLSEYRELQAFYLKNIVKETREISREKGALKGQALELAEVDFEEVKWDTDYELLYLQKEKGQSFLSPALAQSIRLAVDFGSSMEFIEQDPLVHVQSWFETFQQRAAKTLVEGAEPQLSTFLQRAGKGLESPLCADLKHMATALMLAANPNNLVDKHPAKTAHQYFANFQHFLRKILTSREYQRLIAYPPSEPSSWLFAASELLKNLLYHLYTQLEVHQEMIQVVEQIIRSGPAHAGRGYQVGHIACQLLEDYESLQIALSRHPDGPLFKVLDLLQEEEGKMLDLLHQSNLPYKICDFVVEDKKVALLRTPSPTRQEFIHNALIVEEFQGFFRHNWKETFLMIHFQDRLSWQERARAVVIEHLQEIDLAKGVFHVVTLSKDSDFYHQIGPYKHMQEADLFLEQFAYQLKYSKAYHFPEDVKQSLFPEGVMQILEKVHLVFFGGKEQLKQGERLNFIELAYLFLELKVFDLVRPRHFSFTCKDGVDTSMGASAALYAGMKILLEHKWEEKDRATLYSMVFVPSLLMRERAMLPERFDRLIKMLAHLEKKVTEHVKGGRRHFLHEEIAPLYEFDLFNLKSS